MMAARPGQPATGPLMISERFTERVEDLVGSPNHELVVLDVDHHRLPVGVATLEKADGQAIPDLALDEALEGSGPVDGVVAPAGQPRPGGVGHLQADAALGQAAVELGELDVDDL